MSEYKYLDKIGLATLWEKIKSYIISLGYTTNKGTVGGSGTSGYLAKWTGTTAVGNGPQLGNSTVNYLRNDGNWAEPPGTITKIQKNGSDLTITNKTVNINVPTSASQLANDEKYVSAKQSEDNAPYIYRAIGGSLEVGNRESVEAIVGGTVAWNQLASVADATGTVGGVPYTISDGKVTLNGTAAASSNLNLMNATIPITANHVYYLCASGQTMPLSPNGTAFLQISSANNLITISENSPRNFIVARASATEIVTLRNRVQINTSYNTEYYPQIVDLTQMFNPTIADYVYSLEQAQAGSGIQWLQSYGFFTEDYIPYSAATLQSVNVSAHVTVGFNQFDPTSVLVGTMSSNVWTIPTGTIANSKALNFRFMEGVQYCFSGVSKQSAENKNTRLQIVYTDGTTSNIWASNSTDDVSFTFVSTSGKSIDYVRYQFGTVGANLTITNFCINFHGERDGEYEPYTERTYPLDSDLILRGIPKLSNGNLYYDGDTYEWDGTVTRYFGERAYQAGDESLTDAITDGTNTVYKLTTPTTESADPFTAVQTVEDGGTEEWTDYGVSQGTRDYAVPVGHKTKYFTIPEIFQYLQNPDILPIAHGGTGATTAAAARTALGLGSAAVATTSASVGNNTNLPTGAAIQTYVTGLGYEANQNAFTTVKVGTTDLVADSKTDTLTITAGNNITLTPTASSDSFSIAATNTTYSNATTAAAGLMSAADKIKVDKTISEAGLQDNSYASSSVADSTRIYMNIKGTDENLEENNVNLTIPMSGTGTTSGWFHAKAAVIQKKMNGEGYVLVGAFPLADTTNGFILDENVMDSTTIAAWEAIL